MNARLAVQLLSGRPARDPVAVVERLLAVQAQDPRGARLAIRARSTGLTATDVDRALTEERSLVVGWLNRGTLHLVQAEDYGWLHALTTPPLRTGNARRLAQEGVSEARAERAVRVIERALADEGPLTRAELRDRLDGANVPTAGQALVHLLFRASLRGVAVRGPMRGAQHAFALVRDWLGEPAPVDRDRALAELGRRYLAGHAPADERDLAKWAGLPLRDARAALAAASPPRRRSAAEPPPRLLGAFDPVLLGWASREEVAGPHERRLVAGGLFRPFALVGGRAAATWRIEAGTVVLEPFGRLARADRAALEADAEDVLRFLSR